MDERIEGYLRLMELEPENSAYYVPLSKLYVEKGDEEKAIDLLETATEKTYDANVELELENLKNPVPEGASNRMKVRGRIIYNVDEYRAEWEHVREKHLTQLISIVGFSVRFSQPISVSLNNKTIEIQEAEIRYGEKLSFPLMKVDENRNGEPAPIVGKEINLEGYFNFDKDYQKITGPTENDFGEITWVYHPNGPYSFILEEYYE